MNQPNTAAKMAAMEKLCMYCHTHFGAPVMISPDFNISIFEDEGVFEIYLSLPNAAQANRALIEYIHTVQNIIKSGDTVRSPVGLAYHIFQKNKFWFGARSHANLSKEELQKLHAVIFHQDSTSIFVPRLAERDFEYNSSLPMPANMDTFPSVSSSSGSSQSESPSSSVSSTSMSQQQAVSSSSGSSQSESPSSSVSSTSMSQQPATAPSNVQRSNSSPVPEVDMQSFHRVANEMVRQMSQDPTTKDLMKTKQQREAILQREVNTEKGKEQTKLMETMRCHGLMEGEIVELLPELLDEYLEPYGDQHYTEGEAQHNQEGGEKEKNVQVEVQDDMKHNATMLMFRKEEFRKFLKFMYIHFGVMISPDVLAGNWYLDVSTEIFEDGSQSDEESIGSFEDGKQPGSENNLKRTLCSEDDELYSEDDEKKPLTLVVKTFSPTQMTGGCASHNQIDSLHGTDGHGILPPTPRYKRAKVEGAYVEVARDRLDIENPQKVSWQIVNLNWAKLKKNWLDLFHEVLPFLPADHILFQMVQMMNIASAKACELFIPFLKKALAEHGIQVERISLAYADKAKTEYSYDDEDGNVRVHTVFNSPELVTKHFDGVPSMEDYHASHYRLSTSLYPKEHEIACENHYEHMMQFYGKECGASSQKELVEWIGEEGQCKIFSAAGLASDAMSKKQQQDIAGRRNETTAMNRARTGAQSRREQTNLEPIRSVVRQSKFGRNRKCPVLVDGQPCNGTIISGGSCPHHGGGQRNRCPFEENGKTCNGFIISGGFCPRHGGGQKNRCPFEENGKTCNGYIISGGFCPRHGGGQKNRCPFEENGKTCNGYIISGGFCPHHGGGQTKGKSGGQKRYKKKRT